VFLAVIIVYVKPIPRTGPLKQLQIGKFVNYVCIVGTWLPRAVFKY